VVGLGWYPCSRLEHSFSLLHGHQVGLFFFNYHNDARSNRHNNYNHVSFVIFFLGCTFNFNLFFDL